MQRARKPAEIGNAGEIVGLPLSPTSPCPSPEQQRNGQPARHRPRTRPPRVHRRLRCTGLQGVRHARWPLGGCGSEPLPRETPTVVRSVLRPRSTATHRPAHHGEFHALHDCYVMGVSWARLHGFNHQCLVCWRHEQGVPAYDKNASESHNVVLGLSTPAKAILGIIFISSLPLLQVPHLLPRSLLRNPRPLRPHRDRLLRVIRLRIWL